MTFAGHSDSVVSGDFSPDGEHVITSSSDSTARIWDIRRRPQVNTFSEELSPALVAWSSDGGRILIAGFTGTIKVWEVEGPRLVHTVNAEPEKNLFGAWAPDESRLALTSDKSTRLVELSSGRTVAVLQGHIGRVWALAFSPDSKRIATAGDDHSVKIWDATDGRLLRSLDAHSAAVWSVAFDAHGARLVTGGRDRKAIVWDSFTGERLLTLDGFKGGVGSVDFNHQDSRIVTASQDKRLAIWDAYNGNLLATFQEAKLSNITSAHFNREGTLLITGDWAGVLSIWDVSTARLLSKYSHGSDVLVDARFSPDGRWGITESRGPDVVLWDLKLDRRSTGAISNYVLCRVPFRLDNEKLVQTTPEASACNR
jgi:WD40 repeat protein